MEKLLLEMIEEFRNGNKEGFVDIVDKMSPLIESYARKLYTWEQEDARQEMILALLIGIRKITYCRSEGECVNYIKMCIHHAYVGIVKKETKYKTDYAEMREVIDYNDEIGLSELYLDLEGYLCGLGKKKRKIAESILISGKNDNEIAQELGVSRQYINKLRHKMQKDITEYYL